MSSIQTPIVQSFVSGTASTSHPERYDGIARLLHWLFALGIIYASVVGYLLSRIGDRHLHDMLSQLNMSISTVLLVLFPLRAGWKMLRTEPCAVPGMPVWQRLVAHAVHGLLYLLMGAVLLSGYLMVPHGYSFFGVLEIHTPFAQGRVTDALWLVHRISCALLASLVIVHVLAVAKHQLIARTNILRRMW